MAAQPANRPCVFSPYGSVGVGAFDDKCPSELLPKIFNFQSDFFKVSKKI